ncbi:MAG: HPr family phosphocarrier protein [Lachnospiraceae bacterium]|nr:HPr family phosphocarrier protein [Lachnospiraceae bacterium]
MIQYKINLNVNQVRDFVNAASRCDFDVDIAYNSFIVDAKSIVGVLGLDLRHVMTVTCSDFDAEFDVFMKQFAVAC